MHPSIAARAAGARPSRADTPDIDRSTCPGAGKHGTNGAARTRGCTCPDALAARAAYDRRRYLARKPNARHLAVGTRRRLRVLVALGATPTGIAAATGLSVSTIRGLLDQGPGHHYVYSPIAAAVRDLFDRVVAQLDDPAVAIAGATPAITPVTPARRAS